MLKRNMVHIIGSDSHGANKRNFCLYNSAEESRKIIGDYIDVLVNVNPYKVIKGEIITIPNIYEEAKSTNILSKIKRYFNN